MAQPGGLHRPGNDVNSWPECMAPRKYACANRGNGCILWLLHLADRSNSMAISRRERSLRLYTPNSAAWHNTSSRVMAGL